MAPLRRYLRITKYSVLECRIYLDNPALAHSWLLHPRDPVLPRVIASVRPLVLPKLREERERSRKKSSGKKRGIKDVVTEDDFEVSIFLTETNTRHSLLFKHKHFRDTTQTKLTSNSTRLTGGGATREAAIDVDEAAAAAVSTTGDDDDAPTAPPAPPGLRVEEDEDEDVIALDSIPTLDESETRAGTAGKKRRRATAAPQQQDALLDAQTSDEMRDGLRGSGDEDAASVGDSNEDDEDDGLFVDSDPDAAADEATPPPAKRRRRDAGEEEEGGANNDRKKKLAMDVSYEGFSIHGRVLCLVVKRRGGSSMGKGKGAVVAARGKAAPGGQAAMENWITSTQMPQADAAADGPVAD